MITKQIAVFMENKPGKIVGITKLLADNGIDIRAINTADTTDFGILRMIVDDYERAERVLRQSGMSVSLTDVVAVMIDDKLGSLSELMNELKDASVNVEYLYSFIGEKSKAIIVLKTDNNAECIRVLGQKNIKIISNEEMRGAGNAE